MTKTLTFRGIQVTADNYRYLVSHAGRLSDLYLEAEGIFGTGGYARAARALLGVPEEVRPMVLADGNVESNVTGCRYADGVENAVWRYQNGDRSYPYFEANREMLARERAARERTGGFRPEPLSAAFGHLV